MKSKLLHRHDIELLTLVLLMLLGIGFLLARGPGGGRQEGAGWRQIDSAAVRTRIDAGDLSDHEAMWYRRSGPAAAPESGGGRATDIPGESRRGKGP